MDEWCFDLLLKMFNMSFDGTTQTCKAETKNHNDLPKSEKEFIYGIGPNSIPYEKVLRVTTYTEIQEGEFTEIEDTETREIAVGELADQAADRGEEVFDHQADEG